MSAHQNWYLTTPRHLSLYEVKVTRSSESSVWILANGIEHKEKRHSQFADYWPTLQEACDTLRKQAEKQLRHAQEEVQEAEEVLAMIASAKIRVRERHSQAPTPQTIIV